MRDLVLMALYDSDNDHMSSLGIYPDGILRVRTKDHQLNSEQNIRMRI